MRYLLLAPLMLSACFQRAVEPTQETAREPVQSETASPTAINSDPSKPLENNPVPKGEKQSNPRPGVLRRSFAPGETLSGMLRDLGLESTRPAHIIALLRDHMDVNRIPAETPYQLHYDANESLTQVVFQPSLRHEVALIIVPELKVTARRRQTEREIRLVEGSVRHSLHGALAEQDHPSSLALVLDDIFGSNIDFRRLARGTRFQVLYESETIDGEPLGGERVLGARIQHRGKLWQAYLFDDNGWNYYDERGRPLGGGFLISPVAPYPVSSPWTRRRFHPVLKRFMPHLGTDYAAPYGSPVVAVADGRVVEARYTRYNGNYVKIKHNETYQTQYLHFSRFAKGVKPGKIVRQGDVIGYVGNTGLASGTHLCYRFWKNGKQVDPRIHRPNLGGGEPAGDGFTEAMTVLTAQMGNWNEVWNVARQ